MLGPKSLRKTEGHQSAPPGLPGLLGTSRPTGQGRSPEPVLTPSVVGKTLCYDLLCCFCFFGQVPERCDKKLTKYGSHATMICFYNAFRCSGWVWKAFECAREALAESIWKFPGRSCTPASSVPRYRAQMGHGMVFPTFLGVWHPLAVFWTVFWASFCEEMALRAACPARFNRCTWNWNPLQRRGTEYIIGVPNRVLFYMFFYR